MNTGEGNSSTNGGSGGSSTKGSGGGQNSGHGGGGGHGSNAAMMKLHAKEYWWTMAGFIGVLAIVHATDLISNSIVVYLTSRRSTDVEKSFSGPSPCSSSFPTRAWRATKSLLNTVLFRITIPMQSFHNLTNIAEVILVLAYMGAIVAWALIGSNLGTPTSYAAKSGLVCTMQIPFIVALAGKNNVISTLTGLGYEKLNALHRAAGRIVVVIGWVHMSAELWKWAQRGNNKWNEATNQWGMAALIAVTLATALSFRPIRHLSYEFFLMGHIVLVLVFMIGAMYHTPQYIIYGWPGFVFWAFDRFVRVCRVVVNNFFLHPSKHTNLNQSITKSTVELLSDDTIRLTVHRPKNLLLSWRPGQHFYLIAPGVSALPWEAHPFTPASVPHTIDAASSSNVEIDFIIRGRNGFTGRLLSRANSHEGLTALESKKILVDGPYGQPPNLGVYDTTILIAGGSGVSYTLAMLLDRIHQAQQGISLTSRVLFVWAIRDASHISWIAKALQKALSATSNPQHPLELDIRVFITRGARKGLNLINSEDADEKTERLVDSIAKLERDQLSQDNGLPLPDDSTETLVKVVRGRGGIVQFELGRPDVRNIIDGELAASDGLQVFVDVAGPILLASSVKKALASSSFASPGAAMRGGPNVQFHTETFGW